VRSVSLKDIARILSAEYIGSAKIKLRNVGTDSREIKGKDLFFALRGEKYDGHSFLYDLPGKGVKAAVVERSNSNIKTFRKKYPSFPLIFVDDTLVALGKLASWIRSGLDVVAIGITGSTGKTCTKDMLASILECENSVTSSKGSFNNEIGLPLTILSAKEEDRYLVCEVGARKKGDIRNLTDMLKPQYGIITNVGITHLQIFGSRASIASAKAELAESLPTTGAIVLNATNGWGEWIRRRSKAKIVWFGGRNKNAYRARRIRLDKNGRPSFEIIGPDLEIEVLLNAIGLHQVENALAAAACAAELGIKPETISKGLKEAKISPWRMDPLKSPGGFTVLNDAYNANPDSMKAALSTLKRLAGKSRSIAVLGGMAELGAESKACHIEVGKEFVSLDLDILVVVGENAFDYARAALLCGARKGSIFKCRDIAEAESVVLSIVEPGDFVLVKGSRIFGLEKLACRLANIDLF